MLPGKIHRLLTYCIAAVWMINGLFFKVLNLVPRHEKIVARIVGTNFSHPLVMIIGFSEITIAAWILSGIKTRLNAIVQIAVVAGMNIFEFVLAPDLLLWGRVNIIFAALFALTVYYNEFHLNKK